MINFDALNNAEKPANSLLIEGWHKMEIKKAEMKTSKNGDPYLNVGMQQVTDGDKGGAFVFDIFKEASEGFMLFKLKQFLTAFGIQPEGDFELSDLTKILVGKQAMVELKIDSNKQYGDRSVVDIRNEMYLGLDVYVPEPSIADRFKEVEDDIPFEATPEPTAPAPALEDEEI